MQESRGECHLAEEEEEEEEEEDEEEDVQEINVSYFTFLFLFTVSFPSLLVPSSSSSLNPSS